jgi:hypothetical protein
VTPREVGAVALRDQDGGADLIQQLGAARAPDILRERIIAHRLTHGGDDLRDGWIVRIGYAHARDAFEGGGLRIKIAVHPGMIGIAALAGAIQHVNLVALFQQQRGPAAAAVGRADPIGALSITAMNQDHRIGVAHFARNPVLDVHLHPVAHGSTG